MCYGCHELAADLAVTAAWDGMPAGTKVRTAAHQYEPVMYHRSPSTNRDSIQQHGLLQSFSGEGDGVYLTPQHPGHGWSDHDVWEVNTSDLDHMEPDTGYDGPAYWTQNDVPPHALRRTEP